MNFSGSLGIHVIVLKNGMTTGVLPSAIEHEQFKKNVFRGCNAP
jgi:hypothetical protein